MLITALKLKLFSVGAIVSNHIVSNRVLSYLYRCHTAGHSDHLCNRPLNLKQDLKLGTPPLAGVKLVMGSCTCIKKRLK